MTMSLHLVRSRRLRPSPALCFHALNPFVRSAVVRGVAVAGIAALGLVGLATSASAHDALVSTSPADGATVPVAPDFVALAYTEAPKALGTEISVAAPDGNIVSDGAAELVGTTVRQHLIANRPAGAYTVSWRVTSADGHPVSGTFGFTAQEATGVPVESTSTPSPPAQSSPPTLSSPLSVATGSETVAPATVPPRDEGGGDVPLALGVGAGLVLVGGVIAGVLLVRRRRR